MNKELIKKYKAEFDHWLNGGELLYAYIDGTFSWKNMNAIDKNIYPVYARNPFQISEYHIIVINDEYVEFRKALAEGKTIEYNPKSPFHDRWDTVLTIDPSKDPSPKNYRIKPEEPKFKVGDWLIEIHSGSYAKVLEVIKKDLLRVNLYDSNAIITTESTDFILWQPKLGEWCWFWNKDRLHTVAQLVEVCNEGNRKYFASVPIPNKPHSLGGYYENCEPFLGHLPTNLQGIK